MIWQCPKCSMRLPMEPHEFPIHCLCGFVETHQQAVERGGRLSLCPHRGPVAETITRDLLACGCQTIRLHRCEHFAELVTIQPIRRPNAVDTAESLREAVFEFFPGYAGRSCRGCEIPSGPAANA